MDNQNKQMKNGECIEDYIQFIGKPEYTVEVNPTINDDQEFWLDARVVGIDLIANSIKLQTESGATLWKPLWFQLAKMEKVYKVRWKKHTQ